MELAVILILKLIEVVETDSLLVQASFLPLLLGPLHLPILLHHSLLIHVIVIPGVLLLVLQLYVPLFQ